jgi:hypothetical protein
MLMKRRGNMPTARKKRERAVSSSIRFAATQLAVAGWLAVSLPSTAATIPSSYRNVYRACTGRLLSVDISANEAARACAEALRPRELSRCVVDIKQRTTIAAEDALATCRQVRQPNQLASCVVSISRNSEDEAVPGILNYCGRSLLPERFAECVVGLRRETEVASTQAMETCISASDTPRNFSPNFVPATQTPVQPAPSTLTVPDNQTPLPQQTPAPTVPDNQTPLPQQTPAPTVPDNQTPSPQPTPTPTTPANPDGV